MVLIIKYFTNSFMQLNGNQYPSFKHWVFLPGMAYGEKEKWWKPDSFRPRPHEGIDFCCFEDEKNKTHQLWPGDLIPFFISGQIISICKDFVAESVFVKGECQGYKNIIAIHSHINSCSRIGDYVQAGEIAGAIEVSSSVPAHFHLSVIGADVKLNGDLLDWNFLNNLDTKFFVDPMKIEPCVNNF